MEGRCGHLIVERCAAPFATQQSRDVTVQKLGRAEEGKNSTRQAPKKTGWCVDIIPIKATYEIKIHPACILVFTELCLPKHLKAILASTELGKVYWRREPAEQLHSHIFSRNGNLWGSPWKRSGRARLRCCCSSVGVFGRQPPSIPHSQVFCYHLPSAPALPADSLGNPSSGAAVYNRRLRYIFSPALHTHSLTNLIWKSFVNFLSRLFFCCLQVSQHNSVRLYQGLELAIL